MCARACVCCVHKNNVNKAPCAWKLGTTWRATIPSCARASISTHATWRRVTHAIPVCHTRVLCPPALGSQCGARFVALMRLTQWRRGRFFPAATQIIRFWASASNGKAGFENESRAGVRGTDRKMATGRASNPTSRAARATPGHHASVPGYRRGGCNTRGVCGVRRGRPGYPRCAPPQGTQPGHASPPLFARVHPGATGAGARAPPPRAPHTWSSMVCACVRAVSRASAFPPPFRPTTDTHHHITQPRGGCTHGGRVPWLPAPPQGRARAQRLPSPWWNGGVVLDTSSQAQFWRARTRARAGGSGRGWHGGARERSGNVSCHFQTAVSPNFPLQMIFSNCCILSTIGSDL